MVWPWKTGQFHVVIEDGDDRHGYFLCALSVGRGREVSWSVNEFVGGREGGFLDW